MSKQDCQRVWKWSTALAHAVGPPLPVPVPGLSSSVVQAVESAGLLRFYSKFDSAGIESKRRDGTSLPMNIAHMSGSSVHGGGEVLDPNTFFEKRAAESIHS